MRNNEVSLMKSFRFKIVFYTFLSLLYTAATEGILLLVLKAVYTLVGASRAPVVPMVEQNAELNRVQYMSGADVQMPQRAFVRLLIAGMIVIGIVLFVVYFLLLTKKFSVYLKEIVTGINKIATGDLTSRIRINDEDEFAFIGRRLNAMADDIRLLMESERKNEKVKNDLITNVAHDLRTPLTSIIGYLDLTIRNPELEAGTRRKYIQVAYDKSLRLEKMIADLFHYTKFSSGEIKLNLAPIDLVKLAEQMMDEFYPSFQEAGLICELISDNEPAVVMADGELLARACTNLISNAIKYGSDGKNIQIRIVQNATEVSLAVINYGELIPEKDLEHVFDRFYRVENSRNLETGGTGLGLAIAKRAVLMHNGTIRVSSTMEGTVFEMTLKKDENHEK